MTIETPMFPPSRRAVLTVIAGGATAAIAIPSGPARALDESPIMADLSRAADWMDSVEVAVATAWASLDAAEERFSLAWLAEHPEPAGKKRHRRWARARDKARGAACLAEHEAVNTAERHRRGAEVLLATLGYQVARS